MKTSDKELDDLFNGKLQHLQAEPSASLWRSIVSELDQKPKKKNLIPGLRIAASILVIISVGLFWLKPEIKAVKKVLPQKVVKLKTKPIEPKITKLEVIAEPRNNFALNTKKRVVKEASSIQTKSKALALKAGPKIQTAINQTSTVVLEQNKPVEIVALSQNGPAIVPDINTILKAQADKAGNEKEPIKEASVLAAQTSKASVTAKRKGIRNVGDLVNLVMAKVDKRPNKLIEFGSDDDGDESNVTGINLGIISLKKEK